MRATVTVLRGEMELTVVVAFATKDSDRVVEALDEDGNRVRLTPIEHATALMLAQGDLDERGR